MVWALHVCIPFPQLFAGAVSVSVLCGEALKKPLRSAPCHGSVCRHESFPPDFECRGDHILYKVKWARLMDTTPYPDTENLKGMFFAMHVGILQTSHACRVCGHDYHITYRRDRDTWEWSRQGSGCRACQRTRKSLTAGTVLEKVQAKNLLNFFDAYCMWTFGYPRRLLEQETGVRHKQWLQWEKVWHVAV